MMTPITATVDEDGNNTLPYLQDQLSQPPTIVGITVSFSSTSQTGPACREGFCSHLSITVNHLKVYKLPIANS